MANYSLLLMITIMVSINVGLGLYDYGISSYNSSHSSMINFANSPSNTMLTGGINGTANLDTSLANVETSDSVNPDTGSSFTDIFKTVSNWFRTIDSSLGVIGSVLTQPMGYMSDIGVPSYICNSFGVVWYLILLFLIVAFFKGGGVD